MNDILHYGWTLTYYQNVVTISLFAFIKNEERCNILMKIRLEKV